MNPIGMTYNPTIPIPNNNPQIGKPVCHTSIPTAHNAKKKQNTVAYHQLGTSGYAFINLA